MGTAKGLISVAQGYIGMDEDDQDFIDLIDYYNENTDGYDMRYWDEWCACFVSVCSLKSGNRGATGTSVNCNSFRAIWREKGIYREPWETPEPGWLIDYDWEPDGIPDHIGIVVDCDGETIHVIEGNMAGEVCGERWIPVGNSTISCFGAPRYDDGEDEEDYDLKYISHYGGPCYRLYNPNEGDHFYTLSEQERNDLASVGWKDEGIAFYTQRGGSDAVYRFYNKNDGDHVFTPFYDEACKVQEAGWKYEEVSFFACGPDDGLTTVHRIYNKWSGDHMLIATATKDTREDMQKIAESGAAELEKLVSQGWIDEFSFAV